MESVFSNYFDNICFSCFNENSQYIQECEIPITIIPNVDNNVINLTNQSLIIKSPLNNIPYLINNIFIAFSIKDQPIL